MKAGIWVAIGVALGFSIANCAHSNEPITPQAQALIDYISGVVLIRVNHEPRVFIFVSKKGEESDILFDQCEHVPACAKLALDLNNADKAVIIDIDTANAPPAKQSLDLQCEQDKALVMPEKCGKDI